MYLYYSRQLQCSANCAYLEQPKFYDPAYKDALVYSIIKITVHYQITVHTKQSSFKLFLDNI